MAELMHKMAAIGKAMGETPAGAVNLGRLSVGFMGNLCTYTTFMHPGTYLSVREKHRPGFTTAPLLDSKS